MSTRFRLAIPAAIRDEIVAHARADFPRECCGYLAGRIESGPDGGRLGRVERRLPLKNVAEQPHTRYQADDREQLRLQKEMRTLDLDLLCIYHSHPTSPPVPSRTDRELSFVYGETLLSMIVSLQGSEPEIRVWGYVDAEPTEREWLLDENRIDRLA